MPIYCKILCLELVFLDIRGHHRGVNWHFLGTRIKKGDYEAMASVASPKHYRMALKLL